MSAQFNIKQKIVRFMKLQIPEHSVPTLALALNNISCIKISIQLWTSSEIHLFSLWHFNKVYEYSQRIFSKKYILKGYQCSFELNKKYETRIFWLANSMMVIQIYFKISANIKYYTALHGNSSPPLWATVEVKCPSIMWSKLWRLVP